MRTVNDLIRDYKGAIPLMKESLDDMETPEDYFHMKGGISILEEVIEELEKIAENE